MTTSPAEKTNLRSRFYLSEIARWLLVIFFFLALAIRYFVEAPDSTVAVDTAYYLKLLRDICLACGLVMLALGNYLRLSGTSVHQKLRLFWLILAVVFALFWLFKGTTVISNQIA